MKKNIVKILCGVFAAPALVVLLADVPNNPLLFAISKLVSVVVLITCGEVLKHSCPEITDEEV